MRVADRREVTSVLLASVICKLLLELSDRKLLLLDDGIGRFDDWPNPISLEITLLSLLGRFFFDPAISRALVIFLFSSKTFEQFLAKSVGVGEFFSNSFIVRLGALRIPNAFLLIYKQTSWTIKKIENTDWRRSGSLLADASKRRGNKSTSGQIERRDCCEVIYLLHLDSKKALTDLPMY